MYESQKTKIKKLLEVYGYVTRNQALGMRITRLSAIIFDLKKEFGMNIQGARKVINKNKFDYVYRLIK